MAVLRLKAFGVFFLASLVAAAGAQTFSDGPPKADAAAKLPMISVQGNRFVNDRGETVIFRGLALTDPVALKERRRWGRKYFEQAKAWNANIVRVPVHPEYWRSVGEDAYLVMLDDAVKWSGELGMYVIIDWHTIGNPLTEVFHRPMYVTSRGETFRFWHTIASRYAKNPVVALYELFNEPTNSNGQMGRMPWAAYREFIEELIYMIRRIDERAIPLVSGPDWGYDLRDVRADPIRFPRVAYVSHPYPQKRRPPWPQQWENDWGFVAEKYPLICTEIGFMSADGPGAHVPVIGDETYGEELMAFFEQRGISWTAWVFDPEWSPQLITGWNYAPTRQGKFFRAKMQELNKPTK